MITPTMIAWTLVAIFTAFSIGYWIGYRDGKNGNIIQRRRRRVAERNLAASRVFPPVTTADTTAIDPNKRRADDD